MHGMYSTRQRHFKPRILRLHFYGVAATRSISNPVIVNSLQTYRYTDVTFLIWRTTWLALTGSSV